MTKLDDEISGIQQELVDLLYDFHRHPELGFREFRTAEKSAGYLADQGMDIQTGIGGTGVVGLLHGTNPSPTLAIRACLDALPVQEQTGLPYSSQNPGVMHACGHDGNMTMTLGAAKLLARHRDEIHGNIKFIFQPSEEDTGGADAMIRAGVLTNPMVDAIIHLHNFHALEQGVISVKAGPVMASSDLFTLEVFGKPGHGAWPHLAVDPIPVAAELVLTLQKIISREIDPSIRAAISIGKIEGGTAENIISEKVTLYGTVRTFDEGVRSFIEQRIKQIADGITRAARATFHLDYRRVMPPLVNDAKLAHFADGVLRQTFGVEYVTDRYDAGLGCEEFSLFLQHVPGLFLYIGNDLPGKPVVPIHAPNCVFNPKILPNGVKALCELALTFCGAGYPSQP